MIREFAGPVEADLALRGIDFRDFYRPGGGVSGLSMRRMFVLIRGLPWDSSTQFQLREAEEAAGRQYMLDRVRHYAHVRAKQEREAS